MAKNTNGSSHFTFKDEQGDPSKSIKVYSYLPKNQKASYTPIVFIMHGHGKNARHYRNSWVKYAKKYHFMIIAPLFSPEQWPNDGYSYASVVKPNGDIQNALLWSYSVIEHLFDFIKSKTGNKTDKYYIYGHSEGGQFVHRLVLFLPYARYEKAVAANPGWYTMPKFDIKYPYGLDGSPIDNELLTRSLVRDFILLLGDRDTDPNHPQLRKTPEALTQGINRFQRGQNFFNAAKHEAELLGAKLKWRLQVVSGATHNNEEMSGNAAKALMGL